MDPLGIDKATDKVAQEDVPALGKMLHGLLDRLNGTQVAFEGGSVKLVIPPAGTLPQGQK